MTQLSVSFFKWSMGFDGAVKKMWHRFAEAVKRVVVKMQQARLQQATRMLERRTYF